MRIKIKRPSKEGESVEERLDHITSWLCVLADTLNVTLANLSEDNFNEKARERLFVRKEENDEHS